MKYNHKHLTLSDRIIIEQGLNAGKTFSAIALQLGKDPTTISKEIRKHRTVKHHKDKLRKPWCSKEKSCKIKGLCDMSLCYSFCKECRKCRHICPQYKPKECGRLNKAPYVCNACRSVGSCSYYRLIYVAKYADDTYHELLSKLTDSRNGCCRRSKRW